MQPRQTSQTTHPHRARKLGAQTNATITTATLLLLLAAMPSALADDEPSVVEDEATTQEASAPVEASELDEAIKQQIAVTEIDGVLVIGRRTADGVPTVPIDAIGSRNVFGPDRVRETGARDMNDLLVNIPAISTRPYNGGEASAPSFSMRGLPDDGLTEYIHILIDGVPASPLQYGWTALSFLPLTTERVYAVDFIRGAHSVRYSPNTVGGILNLVTEPIPTQPTARFQQTIGNYGYSSSLLSGGTTQGDFGVVFSLVDRSGEGYRDDGDFEQTDWNLKLRMNTGEDSWVAGSISYFDDSHQSPGGLTAAQFADDRFGNARPLNRFEGDRTGVDFVVHEAIDRGFIEGFTYWSRTYRNLIAQRPQFGAAATISDWTDTSTQFALGLRFERAFDFAGVEHKLYGGLRYHDESIPSWKIKSTPIGGGAGTTTMDNDLSLDSWSGHLDDTFEPIEGLTLQAGLRWENVDSAGKDSIVGFNDSADFSDVLPGAGASYRTTEHTAVFANWFEGFRAPQVWAYGERLPGSRLDFEESDSTEFGFRWRDWNGLSGSVTRWRARFDDFGVFYTGVYENLGRTESDGMDYEVSVELGDLVEDLKGFSFDGSLTTQNAELRSGPQDGMRMPYAWRSKAAWTLRYRTEDDLTISVGGTRVGRSYSDELETGFDSADGTLGANPARTLWDVRVSKVFELSETAELELAAGVTNATDHDWFVHSRGGFFGGGKVAGAPRQTYLTAGLVVNW